TLVKHVNFLKKDVAVREIMSEYTKMIKLLLTSATSCTAERSFSALRRLKQNHNLEFIMDEFISRNKIHSFTFACST
ncbi:hypothetical protein ALC53_12595, partial [Atta colombica]